MTDKELKYSYREYSFTDLPDNGIKELIDIASEAAQKAYAPYSGFRVGASVELENGQVLSASNQENAAYPSGLCAERSVIFYANANHPDTPVIRMALTAFENGELTDQPVYPCGSCRQVMMETQDRFKKSIEIWMVGKKRIHKVDSVDPLLPLKFSF